MYPPPSAAVVVKKALLFTVLGFLTLALIGPIVALLSVLLSLALVLLPLILVGFLVWTVFQVALHGRDQAWQNVQELARSLPLLGQKLAAFVRVPGHVLARIASAVARAVRTVVYRIVALVRRLGPSAGMALTGVAVGAGMGAAVGAATRDPGAAIAVNAVLGGILATGVAIALSIVEKRNAVPTSQLS